MTPTQARRRYGFQNVQQNAKEVEAALADTQHIREAISDLASVDDTALLKSFGVDVESSTSSCESEDDLDEDKELSELNHVTIREILESVDDLQGLLQECNYNWFEFIACLEARLNKGISCVSSALFDAIATHCYPNINMELLHQSYIAYSVVKDDEYEQGVMKIVNGEIVSESDSDDNPEAYVGISGPLSETGKVLIAKEEKGNKTKV